MAEIIRNIFSTNHRLCTSISLSKLPFCFIGHIDTLIPKVITTVMLLTFGTDTMDINIPLKWLNFNLCNISCFTFLCFTMFRNIFGKPLVSFC